MARKGKSKKEQRLQNAEMKRRKYQEQEAARQEERRKLLEAGKAKEEAQRRKELEATRHPVTQRTLSSDNKSRSKAAGLKSTFILNGDELLMTSFGRGSEAVPEKHIVGKEIITLSEKAAFTVRNDNDVFFGIDGRVKGAIADNPLYKYEKASRGQDRISREKLEIRYYGRTFEDNIHIQVIYNILDIEKIMSIHINNIIFTINNLLRKESEDFSDIVGYITKCDKYDDLFKKKGENVADDFSSLCRTPLLAYFNIQIMDDEKKGKKDPNALILKKEELFSILYTLGYMRQMLMHGSPNQNIYKEDALKDKRLKHCLDTINRTYQERVDRLNSNFLNMARKNLSMLFSAFDVHSPEEKAEYVRDYYEFAVRKQFKNQGFSIKYLRECMTDEIPDAAVLRDQKYDSVRGKLYPFINFAIFRYYNANESEAENLVERLRASMNEVEKDSIYKLEAHRIWPKLKNLVLKHILPEMEGSKIKEKNPELDSDVTLDMINSVKIGKDSTLFTKIIFLATLFINGKETNDLLTALISKFEDISALNNILHTRSLDSEFVKEFKFFNNCSAVSEELRLVNSFAHMKRESMSAKMAMYDEALTVLGIDEKEKEFELNQMLDKDARKQNRQKAGLRNFIANNVIESDRFKYLVRYGNVKRIKGISTNKGVMSFVLKDIADAQIVRYYISIYGDDNCSLLKMREQLTDRLTGFTFADISDVMQNDKESNAIMQEEKRQKQALVRLYLTALYLILKNLVYVNSRYSLAFMILERDYWLETGKTGENAAYENPVELAQGLIQNRPYNKKRVSDYMNQNFSNADSWAIKAFRNKVQHLDAVRQADRYIGDAKEFKSWFELYHYIMQRCLINQYEYDSTHESKKTEDGQMIIDEGRLNPATKKYFQLVKTDNACCRDFVKALNTPFAYNLARFKNLTIDGLFDKNRREET